MKPKFSWRQIATAAVFVAGFVILISRVTDRLVFDKSLRRTAAFVDSLRTNRPPGIEAQAWDSSISATVTALHNVCPPDPPGREVSRRMLQEILKLRDSPREEPMDRLSKIWMLLYLYAPSHKEYLDKMHGFVRVEASPEHEPGS